MSRWVRLEVYSPLIHGDKIIRLLHKNALKRQQSTDIDLDDNWVGFVAMTIIKAVGVALLNISTNQIEYLEVEEKYKSLKVQDDLIKYMCKRFQPCHALVQTEKAADWFKKHGFDVYYRTINNDWVCLWH